MKRHHDNRRGRSPRSEIARLEEAIRRESDNIWNTGFVHRIIAGSRQ
jgi:hypothetical protein